MESAARRLEVHWVTFEERRRRAGRGAAAAPFCDAGPHVSQGAGRAGRACGAVARAQAGTAACGYIKFCRIFIPPVPYTHVTSL
eukprot:5035462-Prymnesium_polylepis.2